MTMWRTPGQRLPNDIAWLARKFRRTVAEAENTIMPIVREFCQCDGNWIVQKRLTREWEYVSKTSIAQSERAKARWNKEKSPSPGNAERHQSGNAPTPTPTPTPSKKELEPPIATQSPPRATTHPRFEDFWKAYPRKIGKGAALKAFLKASAKAGADAVVAGAERYRDSPSRDPTYTKHPATWLNAECWNDEEPDVKLSEAERIRADYLDQLEREETDLRRLGDGERMLPGHG